jgi:glycosyltransferase involved in cell wall biosynthesis
MDFLVHSTQKGANDDRILSLGGRIIPCLHYQKPWVYARNFKRCLGDHGPYDIVHSHVHHFSGYVLRLARQAGVPCRIAHSHLDTTLPQSQAGLYRRLYLALMQRWIKSFATAGLAASKKAAAALFGPDWQNDRRWRVLYCGIDLEPFKSAPQPQAIRSELGIPADSFVIGHVGRFFEQKNHAFLVDIAQAIAHRGENFALLLIGDGPLRPAIKRRFGEAGLADKVIFLGLRDDVPRLLGAMDVFLFPSLFEGLGLVLVEAQAAGVPCVISDVVPEEADVVPLLVRRLPLSQSTSTWAEAVLTARRLKDNISQPEALGIIEQSPFNILTSVRELEFVYEKKAFNLISSLSQIQLKVGGG